MTTLVAIAEPGRARQSEPRARSLLLSVLLHVLVVLLLVVMARLMPTVPVDIPPPERLIEVVMVPAPQPAPPPPIPQQGEIPVERMNLSENAEVAQESRSLPPAPPGQAEPPAEQPPQRTRDQDLPTANIAAAPPTPEAAPEAQQAPPQPQPEPAPPTPQPTRFQIDPRDIRTMEPPPGVGEPQVASLPRLPPPESEPSRPAPRAAAPRTLPPRPQASQAPGELREVDLFGNARLPPRRAAAAEPSNAVPGPRSTASEAAFILRQVLRVWTVDYRSARYRDVTLSLRMPLQADGTLGYPWGRNDPWLPNLLIDHYQDFLAPGMESERRLLESFAYAVRLAQPYQIPPTPGPYPRTVTISFRMGDL